MYYSLFFLWVPLKSNKKNLKRRFPNFPPLFNKFPLIMTISFACNRWGPDGREHPISQK